MDHIQASPIVQLPTRMITRHNPDAYCFACDVNRHRMCKTPVPSGPFGSQLLWVDPTYLPIPPIPPIPPTPPASPLCGHPGAPAYCFGVCPISSTRTSRGRRSRSSHSSSGSGGSSPAGPSAPTSGQDSPTADTDKTRVPVTRQHTQTQPGSAQVASEAAVTSPVPADKGGYRRRCRSTTPRARDPSRVNSQDILQRTTPGTDSPSGPSWARWASSLGVLLIPPSAGSA